MSGTRIESSKLMTYSGVLPELQASKMTTYAGVMPELQASRVMTYVGLLPAAAPPTGSGRPFLIQPSNRVR